MSTPPPPGEDTGGGNALTQRLGPLATWVWLLIITLAILGYAYWKNRKNAATQQTGQAQPGQAVPAQTVPDIILQNQLQQSQTQTVTPPAAATPPTAPTPPPPAPTPPPVPGPKPPKKPPKKYETVMVGRWTPVPGRHNLAPWNSTLWGIATHYNVPGGYQALAKLNGIKDANLIHPGQKIKVPVA